MPTIACHMQLLRPGEKTQARRRVCCTNYHVVEGAGYSMVGGQRLDWEDKDVFTVPNVDVPRARQQRRRPGLPLQLQRRASDEGPEPLPG
jgi:gentisate 1,2-dioxygenase